MVQSINTKEEFTGKANSLNRGLGAIVGHVLIGDKGFEFFNARNIQDFIQIPWSEVDFVVAQILFGGKVIRSFAIHTKQNGQFHFAARESGKMLKVMSAHLETDQVLKAHSFWKRLKINAQAIVKKFKK